MSNQSINKQPYYSVITTTTTTSPSVRIQSEEDTFKINYRELMKKVFTKMKPRGEYDSCFPLIQQMYHEKPNYFQVCSPLHQNKPSDMIHFSVELSQQYSTYTFHIYGYLMNLTFLPTEITYLLHYSNEWSNGGVPRTLVKFTEMNKENE